MGAVGVLIMFPLIGLGRDRPVQTAATAKGNGIFFSNPFFGEILPPGIHQAGIQYCDIDASAIVGDLPVVKAKIGHIEHIQIPGRKAIAEIFRCNSIHRGAITFRIGVGGVDKGETLDCCQVAHFDLHGQPIDLRDQIIDLAKIAQYRQHIIADLGVKHNIHTDGAIIRVGADGQRGR